MESGAPLKGFELFRVESSLDLIVLRYLITFAGIIFAAVGGVIAYRAWFIDPTAAVVITETEVRELPNVWRIVGGLAMLVVGSIIAFLAARRTK